MFPKISAAIIFSAVLGLSGCANMQPPGYISQHAQPTGKKMFLNGLTLTEVKSFPEAAWWGMPQIKSTSDLREMARIADATAKISVAAARKGNADLAVAEWLWYRRFATHTMSVMENSIKALDSMKGNSSGATIPGNSLVILPVFSRYGTQQSTIRTSEVGTTPFISPRPVMLAGGGLEALSDALNMVLGEPAAPKLYLPSSGGYDQKQSSNVSELPMNQPVMLDNGIYVERRKDSMVAYNPRGMSVELPLKNLNYLPAITNPSAVRKAAAPFMFAMRDSIYKTAQQKLTFTTIAPPNLVVVGKAQITFSQQLDGAGNLAWNKNSASMGMNAYKANPSYKMAIDINAKLTKIPVIEEFISKCSRNMYGFVYEYKGDYAEIVRYSCTQSWAPMYSKDFYVTGDAAVQTYESLLGDQRIIQDMEREVAKSDAIDDLLSFIPIVGSTENALQCAGITSGAQYMNLARLSGSKQMNVAQLAGWQPSQAESSMIDTAINCVGAIPVIGSVGSAAKLAIAGAKALNKGELAAKAGKYGELLDVLKSTRDLKESAAKTAALFPGNKDFASVISKGHDIMQQTLDAKQTADGLEQILAYYSPQP